MRRLLVNIEGVNHLGLEIIGLDLKTLNELWGNYSKRGEGYDDVFTFQRYLEARGVNKCRWIYDMEAESGNVITLEKLKRAKVFYITGYQKIMLKKWQRGEKTDKDLYSLLRTFSNNIPNKLEESGSDAECLTYLLKNAKVKTDVHNKINNPRKNRSVMFAETKRVLNILKKLGIK